VLEWTEGIDSAARVHADACLGDDVTVAPFAVIGPKVRIGEGTRIGPHVVIDGDTTIGRENVIYPYTTIGFPPQDLKFAGENTRVVIGDRNVFREGCQVHCGTVGGLGETVIGDDCYLMVLSHIAHDCRLGDHVLFANAGTLAGHVEVDSHATIGAYSGVHQFCRIGRHAFVGGYSVVTRDALPYCLTVGNRATCFGPNRVGLRRSGVSTDTIKALDHACRLLFRSDRKREDALVEIDERWGHITEVSELADFVRTSTRGVAPLRLAQNP